MRFGSLLRRYVIMIKPRPRRTNHSRQTLDAMDTFRSDEPNKTVSLSHVNAAEYYMKSCRGGICRSVRRNLPVEYYAPHPDIASRFAASMSLFSDTIGLSPSCLVQGYPWSAVGNGRGSVVDVGGSRGFQCVAIAQSFPDLQFVVQDLPHMINGAKDTLSSDFESRINFIEHEFFTEQPVSADIYLFRIIFHNGSDANVIKILKATVSAMQPSARVVENDYLIPEPETLPLIKER